MKKKISKKNESTFPWFPLFLGVATAIGYYFFTNGSLSKADAINILLPLHPSLTYDTFNSFDANYVIAWATAAKNKQVNFQVAGKTYLTSTGRAA